MNQPLPFFNWSLRRAMATEPDSFLRARIRIILMILIFSLLKAAIVICMGAAYGQHLQVIRASVAFLLYLSITKVVLWRPSLINVIAHIMLIAGLLIIWTNIFIYAHRINLITVQFVFMVALSAFYILGSMGGIIYSVLSTLPVLLLIFLKGNMEVYFAGSGQEFASPGHEIIILLNFISILLSHYLFFEAFRQNLAEKEQLNAQLQESIAEARKLAETKSNFLSTMSHELRTPLNSVVGITELLAEDAPHERQKENLKILQSSTLDLLSLINNVLDINKIDSDRLELETVSFQLADFMSNICSGLKIKAADKRLNFVLNIDPELSGIHVVSDPTRLSQLIYNLGSNAIKFTEKGSITVQIGCVNKTEKTVTVMFSVTDTGIGIHPDRHEKIFELFTQAESHITRKYGGTGLGLAIVKQLLGLFGSDIRLESSIGNGAKFSFTITFEIADEDREIVMPERIAPEDLSDLRILVAEDNDINRLIMKKQLDKLNIKPVIVEDGKRAYEACIAQSFDAVLLDLHMPGMGGYDAIRLIRAIPDPEKSGVVVIAFTASVTEQQRIFEAGFNDFLYKPVNMHELRDKLERMVLKKKK